MSLIYQAESPFTTHQQQKAPGRRPRQLPRSPRWGNGEWHSLLRKVRDSVEDAVSFARYRGEATATADQVAIEAIDLIDQVDSRFLPLLRVLIADLVRQSRK